MKIAVLGGSFNPIHTGHLALADEVCVSLGYDKVLFIPTLKSPHKEMNQEVSAEDRLEMVKLACAGDERFEAEDCEITRGGISYTYQTLEYLYQKYNSEIEGKIGLIMGNDLFSGFHLWKNAEWISENAQIILARRPCGEKNGLSKSLNKAVGEYAMLSETGDFDVRNEPLFKNAVSIKNTFLDISSTEIRNRASESSAFKYLVPPEVFKYIKFKGLYEN